MKPCARCNERSKSKILTACGLGWMSDDDLRRIPEICDEYLTAQPRASGRDRRVG